jgi:hypothetical protein
VGGGFICFGLRVFSMISSAFSLRISLRESGALGFVRLGEAGIHVFLLRAILFTLFLFTLNLQVFEILPTARKTSKADF